MHRLVRNLRWATAILAVWLLGACSHVCVCVDDSDISAPFQLKPGSTSGAVPNPAAPTDEELTAEER